MRLIATLASLIMIGLLPVAVTHAAEPDWTDAPTASVAEEATLAPAEERSWTLPDQPAEGRVLLRIRVRRDAEQMGGYGYYVQYELNGEPLDAARNRRETRLLNKPSLFTRNDGRQIFWNLGDGIWHTFFAPDYQTSTARYGVTLDEAPYTAVLDVTDLVRRGESNVFTARNLNSPVRAKSVGKPLTVTLSLEVLTPPTPADAEAAQSSAALTLQGRPEVRIQPGGGFALAFDEAALPFESTFSYPDGGYNHLSAEASSDAEPTWQTAARRLSEDRWEITAQGEFYSLRRVIEQHAGRVTVRDTFTNLTSEPVGILISNHLDFARLPVNICRMGGRRGQALNDVYMPDNPTLFYPLTDSALGIVADDDVYRNHARLFYNLDTESTGLRDNLFALDAGKSYTMAWSIYHTPSENYFDFINRVRRDWGVNFTIEGPVYFTNYRQIAQMTDEQARELIDRHDAEYLCFWEVRTPDPAANWGDRRVIAMGTGISDPVFEQELELLRTAIDRLNRVAPETKVALYSHCFFVAPEKPDDSRYHDSWIVGPDGKRKISHYNNDTYVHYQPVYPTLTNSYGQAYLEMVDFYLDDLGLDWIYWDESTGPGVTVSVDEGGEIGPHSTYNAWDGHTAQINPETKQIERKFALLPLITRPLFNAVIETAQAKGGRVLFNGAAVTARRRTLPSFVETQWTLTSVYRTHLNTPLAYGYGGPSMPVLRQRLNFGLIYARTYLDYASEVVEHFYPFTPMELHAGWVKGQERIITAQSGEFGWSEGPFKARLLLYGADGELTDSREISEARTEPVTIEVSEGGIAVLERVQP